MKMQAHARTDTANIASPSGMGRSLRATASLRGRARVKRIR